MLYNKLKKPRIKIVIMTIIFLSILCMSTALSASSIAAASTTPQTVAPHAFISVAPNPIGINQTVYVNMWLIEYNPLTFAANPGTQTLVWQNFKLTVTTPSGTTTTLGTYTANDVGSVVTSYLPTEVGNYTFTFDFPGQLVNGTNPQTNRALDIQYTASSATTTLTVQTNPLTPLPQTPLPTSYWQRPIYWTNSFWSSISANWFGINQWNNTYYTNPEIIAPQAGHILWTKPLLDGGLIGGSMYTGVGLSNYYNGKSYEAMFSSPIIMNGILYYNTPAGIQPQYGNYAVNLRTGQQIWYQNDTNEPTSTQRAVDGVANGIVKTGMNYGEVYSRYTPDEDGGTPYLWAVAGSTYQLYDANTGNWILNIANSTGGTAVMDPEGELLVYYLNTAAGTLSMWNSTLCIGAYTFYSPTLPNPWEWRTPTGQTLSWSTGIQWTVTVPIYTASSTYTGLNATESISYIDNGVVMATVMPKHFHQFSSRLLYCSWL